MMVVGVVGVVEGAGVACVVVLVSPSLVTLTPIIALQTGNLVAGRPITEIIGRGTHDHISQGIPPAEETLQFPRAANIMDIRSKSNAYNNLS